MAKRKLPVKLSVKVIHSLSPDAAARLAKVFRLLLRPVAEQPDNKGGTPPTDVNNGGPTTGGNGKGKNHGL